ncbi:RDD family protein [Labedaea rhizosphaerae]|uniref:Putative RDD family membrane protein YckC n=1 Tax=Labedaea rhizosphaerae TaxID=598644 RepID=A0A4R6S9V3_LABRH|nr:RDD family protein [Labedaea rhizosphaerae]TDP96253.1 putative RDD family membrane protein YckC [Labedaea rhizosphaerae]
MSVHRADLQWVTLANGDAVSLGTAGARLLARLLDALLVCVPYGVVVLVVFGKPHGLAELAAVLLGLVVVLVGYDVLTTAARGGSVGKRIMGVVVTGLDGGPPRAGRLATRSLVLFGPAFVPGLGQLYLLCCVISAVADEEFKRGWHDRAAGTVVVAEP